MPRGVIHFGKTFPAESGSTVTHSLHATLSNQQHNSWADLMRASFNQTLKRLTKEDKAFRSALPIDIFSQPDKTKAEMANMIDKAAAAMKEDDQMQRAIWKWQSRFLFRRQPPQEIIRTEDLDAADAGQDEELPDKVGGMPVLKERASTLNKGEEASDE